MQTTQRPTLKTIANELGVTQMTVSKALRGVGRISEETRRLVREKAEEVGYFSSRERLFPSFVKESSGVDHRLRLLCPTIGPLERGETLPYRDDMIGGLRLAMAKMDGLIATDSFRSLEDMLTFLRKERFHAVILDEPCPSQWVQAIRKLSPLICTTGHDFQMGVDSVYFNEARAAALALTCLRKAGHRQIGWLGLHDLHAQFLLPDEEFGKVESADWLSHSKHGTRFAAWLYLSNQHPDLPRYRVSLIDRDWRTCSLEEAVQRGYRELFEARPHPTAIVCGSNPVARELIRQLESHGLRVPRDISVTSYGVEEHGKTESGLQLAGLQMPMEKVGGLVPELVQRRLAYPEGLSISIQLDCEWNAGESVRRLPQLK